MPVEPVNNNSLGVLQPIRPPQYQLTNPNPLNPAPFFQALQFNNQQQQMELQRLDQGLRQKELDFRQSALTFQQTKEILDYQNKAFENLYESNKQGTGSVQSPYGSVGVDTRYKLGQAFQAKIDADVAGFLDSTTKSYGSVAAGTGEPNSKDLNKLLYEMSSGQNKLQQSILQDPMYRELTGQTRQFGEFMKQVAEARKNGLYVDQRKVDEVLSVYERLQNGESESRLADIGALNRALPSIQNIVFDADGAVKRLNTAATEIYKPYEIGEDVEDPRAPGTVFTRKREVRRSLDEGTAELINFAKSDPDLIKMFSAATGLYNPEDPKFDEAFGKWVRNATAVKAPLKGYENIITDAGPDVIRDPADFLKGKAGRTGSVESRFGNTEAGIRAQLKLDDFNREGLEVISGGDTGVWDYSQMKPGTTIREVDEETGNINIYKIQVDSDGNPIMKKDLNEKGKAIPGTEHVVKVGDPILVLGKRKTTSPSAGDDIGSQNNNPGNIRATPEQIRRGTVKVDNNGFIIFDTIEQGLEASAADNEKKISGQSSAMKTSPYMIAKYGKDKLDNYQEFATVEDLINVRTPRASLGGDNTNASVDSFLVHLDNRGFPRDLKLSELNDEDKKALNKAIVEFESPSSFNRLFNPQPQETTPTPTTPTPTQAQAGSGLNAVQEAVSEVFSKNLGKEEIAKIYELTGKPVPGKRVVSFRSPATVFRPEEVSESELLRPLVEENFPEGAVNSYKKFGDYIFDIIDAMDGPAQLDDYIPALKNYYAVVKDDGTISVIKDGKGTDMDKAEFYEFIRENGAAEAYRHSNPTETLAPKSDLLKSYGF